MMHRFWYRELIRNIVRKGFIRYGTFIKSHLLYVVSLFAVVNDFTYVDTKKVDFAICRTMNS